MSDVSEQQEVLIVTGMSGAGRSTVGNALEDLDWYVVDNLPAQMLRPLLDLAERAGDSLPKIAAVVDVRGGRLFSEAQEAVRTLRASMPSKVRVLFLDATDAALVRRFEQVRRPHPLQGDGTLLDGILAEQGRVEIACDFCGLKYHFDPVDVGGLFTPPGQQAPGSSTTH